MSENSLRQLETCIIAPYDVVMSPHDVCEQDLVFVAKDQAPIVTEFNIQGVPTLMIEVLSPGTQMLDEIYRRDRYAQLPGFSLPLTMLFKQ